MTQSQRGQTSGTDHAGRSARSLRPAIEGIDVRAQGAALQAEPAWESGDRNSKTLLKTESLRAVLTALRDGAVMENDDPDESVTIQALEGTVEVAIDDATVTVGMGQLVCLAGGDPWRISAKADSLILLSMGRARTLQTPPGE